MIQQALYQSIGRIFLFCIIGQAIGASALVKNVDLHFWPTVVEKSIENESYLYVWPEFKVLLQTKDNSGRYLPAVVPKETAKELERIFEPGSDSPIRIFRDDGQGFWGLVIPGGYILQKNNGKLLEYMSKKFVDCLGSLSEHEINVMKEVINIPYSFLNNPDGLITDETKKSIIAKMLDNFRNNSCALNKVIIPEQLKKKSERYLNYLLVGNVKGELITQGEILVFSTVFNDFLFSANGLWVKAVLSKIKEFVTSRANQFPIISDAAFLQRDYESFIDFILMNKNEDKLTKEHYISFAEICGVHSLQDIFLICPLKQLVNNGKITALNLHLGSIKSVHFIREERL